MLFFCLPISGQYFGVQLGQVILFIESLNKLNIKNPDVVFSSSGGNLVSYISHCCNWNTVFIRNSIRFFDTESFLSNWLLDKIPFLNLVLNKTMHSKGYGFQNFFKFYYEPNIYTGISAKAYKGTEILTGVSVFCSKENKSYHKIFSNKKKEDSLFKNTFNNSCTPYLCEEDEIEYMAGNVKHISDIVSDSASIPYLVPARKDNDEKYYSDGGAFHSSPFPCFSHILRESNEILKGIFFNPSNCEIDQSNYFSLNMIKELSNLMASIYSQEIRIFINLITSFDNMLPFKNPIKYNNLTTESLKTILQNLEATNYHYGIILYPNKEEINVKIKMNCKMRIKEVEHDINFGYNNVNAYVWCKKK